MSNYTVYITPDTFQTFKNLPGNIRQRVKQAIRELADNPRPTNSKMLDIPNLIDILYAKPNGEIEENLWWIEFQLKECFTPEYYYRRLAGLDFCFSVLNLVAPPQEWEIFKSLVQECGWIFAYDDICIVCDRPLHLRFDNQNRLHAEGEPAIEFTDGYSLYFHHGIYSRFACSS